MRVVRKPDDLDEAAAAARRQAEGAFGDNAVFFERYLEHNLKYHRNAGIGNILNLCAVSVPCGFTRDGLPVGLMVYAKPFQEDVALRVAYAYEQATEWHARRPGLAWTGAGRFAA